MFGFGVFVFVTASVSAAEGFSATNSSAEAKNACKNGPPSGRNHSNRCAQICRNGAPKTVTFQLIMSSKEELIAVHIHVNPLDGG